MRCILNRGYRLDNPPPYDVSFKEKLGKGHFLAFLAKIFAQSWSNGELCVL